MSNHKKMQCIQLQLIEWFALERKFLTTLIFHGSHSKTDDAISVDKIWSNSLFMFDYVLIDKPYRFRFLNNHKWLNCLSLGSFFPQLYSFVY